MERNHFKTSITSSVLSLSLNGSGFVRGFFTIERELASNTVLCLVSELGFDDIFLAAIHRETILVATGVDVASDLRVVFKLELS